MNPVREEMIVMGNLKKDAMTQWVTLIYLNSLTGSQIWSLCFKGSNSVFDYGRDIQISRDGNFAWGVANFKSTAFKRATLALSKFGLAFFKINVVT